MKKIMLAAFILATQSLEAQQKFPYWTAGLNPLSLGESLSSIGPCTGYRVTPVMEFWAEGSYIFYNLYKVAGWEKVHGYRFIFQPRFYLGADHRIFLAPELRIKNFSYQVALPLVNPATADTLDDYRHRARQFQLGGALVIGMQICLSGRKQLFLELTAGIGGKERFIKRKNIPAGYVYEPQRGGFGLAPHYEWDQDGTPYVPLGARLIWKLARGHK